MRGTLLDGGRARGAVVLLFGALAVVWTWPLALHATTHLPLGTESSATVPLFNLWTLRWNADRLAHGYAGYWDAPIFFPNGARSRCPSMSR